MLSKKPRKHTKPVKKILILSANPKATPRLRLDEEVREIEEGLRLSKHRDRFEINSRWAVRIRDIRRALLDIEPQIVHFIGHGKENVLLLEDEVGLPVPISAKALAGLFELCSTHVECVILSACYSVSQAEAIERYINYVIGMQGEIKDKASIEFAVGFYDALGAGRSVEDAFKFGCNAILQILPELPASMMPVLKGRTHTPNKNNEIIINTPIHLDTTGKPFESPNTYKAAIKAYNGKYVAAAGGGGGKLVATSDRINEWEIFNIEERPGKKMLLQVHHRQYVGAEGGGGGELIAASSSPQAFEVFTAISLENNKMALKAHNGDIVSVKNDGTYELVANRAKIRAREIFTLIKQGPGRGGNIF